MKHILLSFLFCLGITTTFAQYPGNAHNWVTHSKEHYKFKIAEKGIYRIHKAELEAAGMNTSDMIGADFQLYHNGEVVPLYVSTEGPFSNGDYIEFWGKPNDGHSDTPLYEEADWQPSTHKSLFEDAGTYFLTTTGNTSSIKNGINDLTNLPAKEEYFMHKSVVNYDSKEKGASFVISDVVIHGSQFSTFEGYARRGLTYGIDVDILTEDVYTRAPEQAKLDMVFAPWAYRPDYGTIVNYTAKIGSTTKGGSAERVYRRQDFHVEYPLSDIKEGNTKVEFREDGTGYFTFSETSITYPRTFNFTGNNQFEIQGKSGGRYYEFKNIPKKANDVIFYDVSTDKRYTLSHSSSISLRTDNSSQNTLLYDNEVSSVTNIEKLGVLKNLLQSTDVLLIYPKLFDTTINGENLIEKYVEHRESEFGGKKTVLPVLIDDIVDQYAYGIKGHSAAIKNYLLELNKTGNTPTYVTIMGKGLEYSNVTETNESLNLVPTFGQPGSDNFLVSESYHKIYRVYTSLGRISADTVEEANNYLDKLIEYETRFRDLSDIAQTKEKEWMKKVVHLGGGANIYEQRTFKNYLESYQAIIEDPSFGADVTSLYKQSTNPIDLAESVLIDELIDNGVSLLTFFGHASQTALEFDIRNPEDYTNVGKYPLMVNNGCFIGNVFGASGSMSEDWIVAKDRGAIGFLGPSLYGISSSMNVFTKRLYEELSKNNYNKEGVGESIKEAINNYTSNSSFAILTKQQMIFNGDPSIVINSAPKPDYLITQEDLRFMPDAITSEAETFDVAVNVTNIGASQNEEVVVRLLRTLPNGDVQVYDQVVNDLYFKKEVVFTLETNAATAEGINSFQVQIDPDDLLDEVTRANNNLSAPIQRQISSSNVTPVVPFEFAITNNRDLTLYASTLNTDATDKNFVIEIDTTEMFNSPLLKSTTVQAYGGTISWKPSMNYQNEQEYYWRTKLDEDAAIWDSSSFIYLDDYDKGWNQSDYYQFNKNQLTNLITQQSETKVLEYTNNRRALTVQSGVYPVQNYRDLGYALDGYVSSVYRLMGDVGVVVLDRKTGEPWKNEIVQTLSYFENIGKYRSRIRDPRYVEPVFWYKLDTPENRKDFMDLLTTHITENEYVLIYTLREPKAIENNWKQDKALYGTSIYEILKEKGASLIDDIQDETPYVFFYQNGNVDYENKFEELGVDRNSYISQNLVMKTSFSIGKMLSPAIGPAANWDKFEWNWTSSYDNEPLGDEATYTVYGITPTGENRVLFEDQTGSTLDLSSVSATQYPYLRLAYTAIDAENQTPPQLDYWRIIYERVGELAINVNSTVEELPIERERGQDTSLKYSIDNIGKIDYSRVLVRYTFTDANGTVRTVDKTYEGIKAGESREITFEIPVEGFENVGINSVLIDVNPDEDQLEQHHFNNIAYFNYSITKDVINPYLDVTFDGIHILDGDLVSDTPSIIISLTDDNKYFALDNPDDFEIVVTTPTNEEIIYTVANEEVTFYAGTEENNVATIEFKPTFNVGKHSLEVRAKDRSNNFAADNNYIVDFEVTDEDIVTQVINYPNPFTTRTSFIANIVGEKPDQILIQIFAPNGQVVRELQSEPNQVTVAEGNNYYELAEWDGNDEFGDPVGNGAYFYKITLKRNGQTIEPKNDEVYSKYFKNGIGKLYILR